MQMKNSGIEWIGEIPDSWKLYKIGSLFGCRNKSVNDTDYPPLSVSKGGIVPQMDNVAKSGAVDNRKLVLKNDFVINSRSDRKQSCGFSRLDGSVSLINTVMYVLDENIVLPEYTDLMLKNCGFAEEFYRWGHGIVADLWTTNWQEMKNIVVPLPPLVVQEKIICRAKIQLAKIDELIANQQAQIEKLKEYKQSIITEAVTKGLDKSIPMKDSGIEWLGEINKNHFVFKLKYLLSAPMMYGANESGESYAENSVRYIRITDITSDSELKDGEDNLYLTIDKALPYLLNDGDVLFARSGGTVGKSFIYRKDYGVCAFAGYLIKAECNKQKLLPQYLYHYTHSSLYELWKNMIFIQSTIQNIGANKYSNMEIACPDMKNQIEIVNYLTIKCSQIDKLIVLMNQKIEKLQEYKKSLIYEYVTGKKEVV